MGNEADASVVSNCNRLAEVIAKNFDNEFDDEWHGYWTASAAGGLARFTFIPMVAGVPAHRLVEVYEVSVTRVEIKRP